MRAYQVALAWLALLLGAAVFGVVLSVGIMCSPITRLAELAVSQPSACPIPGAQQ